MHGQTDMHATVNLMMYDDTNAAVVNVFYVLSLLCVLFCMFSSCIVADCLIRSVWAYIYEQSVYIAAFNIIFSG